MYDLVQFRALIERTLTAELFSVAAVRLLLGTAAVESEFGTFLRQQGGPALGAFQIEPSTHVWLRDKYSARYPLIAGTEPEQLEWDLRLGIIVARLRYRAVPEPLPDADDVRDLGRYWKEYYNTIYGQGTIERFVRKYEEFIGRP